MIEYVVTAEFPDPAWREPYVAWLRDGHIAAVVAAGKAISGELVLLDSGSVASRYVFPSREAFAAYEAGPAAELRADGADKFPFGSGVSVSRSIGDIDLVDRGAAAQ